MATISKTGGIVVLAHEESIHPTTRLSAELDVADDLEVWMTVEHAAVETTAQATAPSLHILINPFISGDEGWKSIVQFDFATAAAETEALTATEGVGVKSIAMASTTNLLVDQTVYIQDASVVTAGEWHRLENVISNTSVELYHGLAVEKDSSDFIFNQAEAFDARIPIGAMKRLKVYYVHRAATGSNTHLRVTMVRADSIG